MGIAPKLETTTKPDVPDASELMESTTACLRESDGWKNSIELPDDTTEWVDNIELPDDSDDWQGSIDLGRPSARDGVSAETDDSGDKASDSPREMTEDEINEAQRAAIQEAFKRMAHGEELTNAEKGNLCEMMMDQYYISKGYKPLHDRVISLNHPGHKGIDGVYEKQNPDGTKEFVIADAKYDSATLGVTADGRQLSDTWIDARLDGAVGKEKADEIRDAYEDNPDSIRREVYHYDPHCDETGNTYTDISSVDSDGIQSHKKETAEIIDEYGNVYFTGDNAKGVIEVGENDA